MLPALRLRTCLGSPLRSDVKQMKWQSCQLFKRLHGPKEKFLASAEAIGERGRQATGRVFRPGFGGRRASANRALAIPGGGGFAPPGGVADPRGASGGLTAQVCASPAIRIHLADRVDLDGRRVRPAQPTRLWRYCKPVGVIVSRTDPRGRRSLSDSLPARLAGVMPVGRLDASSEGLLLLTNDGALKRLLELPVSHVPRVYRARVRGLPDDAALQALREGLVISGERFRPMGVSVERQGSSNTWLRLELSEGRYREVRRALEHVGHPVNRLRRTAYGPLRIGSPEARRGGGSAGTNRPTHSCGHGGAARARSGAAVSV